MHSCPEVPEATTSAHEWGWHIHTQTAMTLNLGLSALSDTASMCSLQQAAFSAGQVRKPRGTDSALVVPLGTLTGRTNPSLVPNF